jgi:RNA polymerase sigma-70 factor (ECF subfamily)
LNREEGAWEDFVDRYIALITHVVVSTMNKRLGDVPSQWRDDVLADVLLGLVDDEFAVLRRFRGQSSLGTYLVVVARRIAVRKMAKLRRVGITQTAVVEVTTAPEVPRQLENTEEVQTLLAKMPENEAQAIRMYHLEHRSYSDIGTHFGIPENSVGPLLSKARDRMRSLGS